MSDTPDEPDPADQPDHPARRTPRPASARTSGRSAAPTTTRPHSTTKSGTGSTGKSTTKSTAKTGGKGAAKADPPLTYWERKAKAEEARQAKDAKRGHRGRITDLGIGHADHSDRTADRPAGRTSRGRGTGRSAGRSRPKPRPTRRRVLLRRWTALAVVLGVAALVVALLVTPLLGVRGVTVTGTTALSADQVRTAAAVPNGDPMLTLDTSGIAARVATLPRVATVDVTRQWPGTVRIAVTERTPVGVIAGAGGAHLVDATGYDYATVPQPPKGLPVLKLTTASPSDQRTRAVVTVLSVLPAQLRGLVGTVSADTPGDVQLALTNGKTVRWGNSDDSARKVAVLAALLTRPGTVYDVSAPDLPTIS